jgi:hypothetical protein
MHVKNSWQSVPIKNFCFCHCLVKILGANLENANTADHSHHSHHSRITQLVAAAQQLTAAPAALAEGMEHL